MNCDHFWTCPLCSTPCEKLYKNTDFWTCPYCPAWAEPGGGKRMGQVSPRNFPECQPGAKKVMVPVRAGTAWHYGDHLVWSLDDFVHVGRSLEDVLAKVKKRTGSEPQHPKVEYVPALTLRIGALCRRGPSPARYVGGGKALAVSAQDSYLMLGDASPPSGGEDNLPLPTAREVLQRAVTLATDEELDALLQQR